jgi:hypothetical protein
MTVASRRSSGLARPASSNRAVCMLEFRRDSAAPIPQIEIREEHRGGATGARAKSYQEPEQPIRVLESWCAMSADERYP